MCEKGAEGLASYFSENEIEARSVFYPLHKQPCYQKRFINKDEHFKVSLEAYHLGLCLPSYPALEENKINFICDTIKKYLLK